MTTSAQPSLITSTPLSPWSGVQPKAGLLLQLWQRLGTEAEFRRQVVLLTRVDKLISGTLGGVGLAVGAGLALVGVQPGATIVTVLAAALLINMFTQASRTRAKAAHRFATQGYLATLEGFEAVEDYTLWVFLPIGYPTRPWAINVAQAMADQLDAQDISQRAEQRLFDFSTGTDVVRGLIEGPGLIGYATHGKITTAHGYTGRPGEHQSVWAVVPITNSKAAKFRVRQRLVNQLVANLEKGRTND